MVQQNSCVRNMRPAVYDDYLLLLFLARFGNVLWFLDLTSRGLALTFRPLHLQKVYDQALLVVHFISINRSWGLVLLLVRWLGHLGEIGC